MRCPIPMHSVPVPTWLVGLALSVAGCAAAPPPGPPGPTVMTDETKQTIVLQTADEPPSGPFRVYDAIGRSMVEGALRNGVPHGELNAFSGDGGHTARWTLTDGVRNGPFTMWYGKLAHANAAGRLKLEGAFVDGLFHGTVTRLYPTGNRQLVRQYEHGALVSCEAWRADGTALSSADARVRAEQEHARDLQYFTTLDQIVTQTLDRGRRTVAADLAYPASARSN